jgi:hypothetical protein
MAARTVSAKLPIPVFLTDSTGDDATDTTNNAVKVALATTIAGEDVAIDVLKTEQRFAYSQVTADTAVKSAPGFLHTLTFAQTDAAPTAGTITVYDNTAESGTKIFEWNLTTTVFMPFTVTIDATFATGLYVGFATTADVAVTVSYR